MAHLPLEIYLIFFEQEFFIICKNLFCKIGAIPAGARWEAFVYNKVPAFIKARGRFFFAEPILIVQIFAGWLLGWLRYLSDSILPGWVVHSLINTLGTLVIQHLLYSAKSKKSEIMISGHALENMGIRKIRLGEMQEA